MAITRTSKFAFAQLVDKTNPKDGSQYTSSSCEALIGSDGPRNLIFQLYDLVIQQCPSFGVNFPWGSSCPASGQIDTKRETSSFSIRSVLARVPRLAAEALI